jgi:hypothetical protein
LRIVFYFDDLLFFEKKNLFVVVVVVFVVFDVDVDVIVFLNKKRIIKKQRYLNSNKIKAKR